MKKTITIYDFRDAFANVNRADNFSYEGLRALYDYLVELEDSTGYEIELDVIALCCEFTEYSDLQEVAEVYDIEGDDEEILDQLMCNTDVVEFEDGIIIQDY